MELSTAHIRHTALTAPYGSPELLDAIEQLLPLIGSEAVGGLIRARDDWDEPEVEGWPEDRSWQESRRLARGSGPVVFAVGSEAA